MAYHQSRAQTSFVPALRETGGVGLREGLRSPIIYEARGIFRVLGSFRREGGWTSSSRQSHHGNGEKGGREPFRGFIRQQGRHARQRREGSHGISKTGCIAVARGHRRSLRGGGGLRRRFERRRGQRRRGRGRAEGQAV